jgi:hypothetical protein
VNCVKSNENALRATVKASPALQDCAAAVRMLLPLPAAVPASEAGAGSGGTAAAVLVQAPEASSVATADSSAMVDVPRADSAPLGDEGDGGIRVAAQDAPPVAPIQPPSATASMSAPSAEVSDPVALRGPFAGLFDFSRDDWRCSSCVTGEHDCYMCGVAGPEGVSVFRCSRMCGKFFHLQCLAKNPLTRWLTPPPPAGLSCLTRLPLNVPVSEDARSGDLLHVAHGVISHALNATPLAAKVVGGKGDSGNLELLAEPVAAVRFVCPYHTCSGCKVPFNAFRPPLYYRCHACPTAYHVSCVPRDARLDMANIITCPARATHDAKYGT